MTRQERRASNCPCRVDSLSLALLCLALAFRHTWGEGHGRTHPDDVAAALRFRAPHVVAGCETELAITAVGMAQGVTYRLMVSVARGGDVIYAGESSVMWTREVAYARGDVHVFTHALPPLCSAPHTVRATLLDAAANTESETELASMVQRLDPAETPEAGASCARQPLDVVDEDGALFVDEDDVLAIVVLSARQNFERREAIRQSWAKGFGNVYFIVSAEACHVPFLYRANTQECNADHDRLILEDDLRAYKRAMESESEMLMREWQTHGDIVIVNGVEVYRNLPDKLKQAFRWASWNTKADWILKVDDDCFVHISKIIAIMRDSELDTQTEPVVFGMIARDFPVLRAGKWAETDYHRDTYPPFPLGSAGYMVSRKIVNLISNLALPNYQGEDVSLGVWLDETVGQDELLWVSSSTFSDHGNCWDERAAVIGHGFSGEDMLECLSPLTSAQTRSKDLVTIRRFDLMPKIIYARARLKCIRNQSQSDVDLELCEEKMGWARHVYTEHIKVLNGFMEKCHETQQIYHTFADGVCSEKVSIMDFLHAFDSLLLSLSAHGWDQMKHPRIPVEFNKMHKDVLVMNGAHRVAAMYALDPEGLVPTQLVPGGMEGEAYDEDYFWRRGLPPELLDSFAMQYVEIKTSIRALCLFPSTDGRFAEHVNALVSKFGKQVVRRDVWLNSVSQDLFVQHLYSGEEWIEEGSWMKTNACFTNASQPLTVIFVESYVTPCDGAPESENYLKDLKQDLRRLFAKGKHSVHTSDNHLETVLIGTIILNRSSLIVLNNSDWSSPMMRARLQDSDCDQNQQRLADSHDFVDEVDDRGVYYADGAAPVFPPEELGGSKEIHQLDFDPGYVCTEGSSCAGHARHLVTDNETHACGGLPRIFPRSKTHWKSIEEMWEALNAANVSYALLRNFEQGLLQPTDAHPDIDILLQFLEPACCVMTVYGGPEGRCARNVQDQGQHVTIAGQRVKLDVRIVGDDYYDTKWSNDMLARRVQGRVPNSNAWSLAPADHFFSLIYHVLVHKDGIDPDYPPRLCHLSTELGYEIRDCSSRHELSELLLTHWMAPQRYATVRPGDLNVPYHPLVSANIVHDISMFIRNIGIQGEHEGQDVLLDRFRIGNFLSERGNIKMKGGMMCSGFQTNEEDPLTNFNRAIRSTGPGKSQKYLVYSTAGDEYVGGFGSRLWGIANVFLWALLTNRTFVIEYHEPHPLSSCLKPNIVDWTVSVPNVKRLRITLVDKTLADETLAHGDLESNWKEFDVVEVVGANMPCESSLRLNSLLSLESLGITKPCSSQIVQKHSENERRLNTQLHSWKAMVWHALFRPAEPMLAVADHVLRRVEQFDFALGIHVRLGGHFGGIRDGKTTGKTCDWSCLSADLNREEWYTNCASNITRHQRMRGLSVVWFVSSDHPDSTAWLKAHGAVENVEVLNLPIARTVHTDRTKDQTLSEWRETVADWYVMSQTSHIIQTPSSFSLTAAMWGGKIPTMLGEVCDAASILRPQSRTKRTRGKSSAVVPAHVESSWKDTSWHQPYRIYFDGEPGGASRSQKRAAKYDLVFSMEIPRIDRPQNVFFWHPTLTMTWGPNNDTKLLRSSKRPIDVLYTSSNCDHARETLASSVRVAIETAGLRFEYSGTCSAGSTKPRFESNNVDFGVSKWSKKAESEPALFAKMMIAVSRSQDPDAESLDDKIAKPIFYGAIPLYQGTGARLAKAYGYPSLNLQRENYESDDDFAQNIVDLARDSARIDLMQEQMMATRWGGENHCQEAHRYIELHPPDWLKTVRTGVLTVSKNDGQRVDETHAFFKAMQCLFGKVGDSSYALTWGNKGEADIEIEQCCWA